MKPSDQSASAPDAPPFMAPGFLTRRTAELDRVIDDAIDRGRIVGTVVIAAHKGETVYQRAAGYADRESHRPALTGEIFRLASMTKAIVSAAVLALADQGKLSIDDPVTRWLPSFRPTLADGAARREPGTRWHYSVAVDVLGAVLERVTGSSLPEAVRALVTAPLGLASLRFVVPKDASIATPYGDSDPRPTAMTPVFELPFFGSAIRYSPARIFDAEAFSSGGTGMVGTAADYLRFIEAIRSGGAGVLREHTAAAMTQNAIGELCSDPGFGWGLGVQVLIDPAAAQSPLSAGAWNWGGVYGSHFWVDPAKELSVVALTNTAVAGMMGEFPSALQRAAVSE